VTPDPSFVLSGPRATVYARGIAKAYRDVAAARHALQYGSAPIILGALPFHSDAAPALWVPDSVHRTAARPRWPPVPMPAVRSLEPDPPPEVHRTRVSHVIDMLREPGTELRKVVLARAMRIDADAAWDLLGVLSRLLDADPAAYGYLVDLSAAGAGHTGAALVGASPELLVCRSGDRVTCRPFAGSMPRSVDPAVDRANARALAESGKNRHEHQMVVDVIRTALDGLCTGLHVTSPPELHRTDALWHLSTPITGRLRERSTSALDLTLALHPTPAVGGVPAGAASALIREIEGDRGFYAGAVGWCDASGDGSWVVAIRGAQLSPDRRSAVARSGGGIVAESDPDDELDETTAKFRTILTGLGVTA
jgi:isochorismate synthase